MIPQRRVLSVLVVGFLQTRLSELVTQKICVHSFFFSFQKSLLGKAGNTSLGGGRDPAVLDSGTAKK